mgnify:FL=1
MVDKPMEFPSSDSDTSPSNTSDAASDSSTNEEFVNISVPRLVSYETPLIPVIVEGLHATAAGHNWLANNGKNLRSVSSDSELTSEEVDAALQLELQKVCHFLDGGLSQGLYITQALEHYVRLKLNAGASRIHSDAILHVLSKLPNGEEELVSTALANHELVKVFPAPLNNDDDDEVEIQKLFDILFWWNGSPLDEQGNFDASEVPILNKLANLFVVHGNDSNIVVTRKLNLGKYTEKALPLVKNAYEKQFQLKKTLSDLTSQLNKVYVFEGQQLPETLQTAATSLRKNGNKSAADELEREVERINKEIYRLRNEIGSVQQQLYANEQIQIDFDNGYYLLKAIAIFENPDRPVLMLNVRDDDWILKAQKEQYSIRFEEVQDLTQQSSNFIAFYESSKSIPHCASSANMQQWTANEQKNKNEQRESPGNTILSLSHNKEKE